MSELKSKVEKSIERLKAFEPKEGYYLAFSGGKDSVVCNTAYSRIRRIMSGQQELRKSDIDRFIRATGMKYEELFAEEESNG